MTWKCYECLFQIKSPLHIGFHKVLHFAKTRMYVPGRLLWAALTAKLAPMVGMEYQVVGEFLKKSMRFGYFYLYSGEVLYLPKYTEHGLKFDSLFLSEFEKKFISSKASVAIEPESLTAHEGMLYEVEFISPYTVDTSEQVFLKGYIWIREFEENRMKLLIEKKDFVLKNNNEKTLNLENELLDCLQIGGERRCGFGLIKLKKFVEINSGNLNGFKGNWKSNNEDLIIELKKDEPIWAHLKCSNFLALKGDIEPLIEREWDLYKGAGKKIKSYGLFWVPGSILCENKTLKITESSFWEVMIC